MNAHTAPTASDRRNEAARYRRYARTADRLREMSQGRIRTYRGDYPHNFHMYARVADQLAARLDA